MHHSIQYFIFLQNFTGKEIFFEQCMTIYFYGEVQSAITYSKFKKETLEQRVEYVNNKDKVNKS